VVFIFMHMKKKPLHLKEIDKAETMFFYFKLDATTYILYDSDMGEPVSYGSLNIVGGTISKLNPKSTIFYFELDNSQGWKMKKSYKPTKITSTQEDKKSEITSKKDESKSYPTK
jgi:hypothetical protein